MGRKVRISERQKSVLRFLDPDLLQSFAELEELREKVRLAEAANRVLH
jgi:hypothetical protein